MFLLGKLTWLSTQSPQSGKHYCTLAPTEDLPIAMVKGNGHSGARVYRVAYLPLMQIEGRAYRRGVERGWLGCSEETYYLLNQGRDNKKQ